MIITVTRRTTSDDDDAILGTMTFEDGTTFSTLERLSLAIPLGTYPVQMTVSGRAVAGTLWSPLADHKLPLIDPVPGRSGIRIHAANLARQLEGCIAVGRGVEGTLLVQSRAALIAVCATLDAATDAVHLTVQEG